ncbi:hypothetical protein CBM2629_B40251 [Cupriavidus taiwanensis]|nr:hypothetical protein CBM2629_B40251 [Cupriavidus taiwanensis]
MACETQNGGMTPRSIRYRERG